MSILLFVLSISMLFTDTSTFTSFTHEKFSSSRSPPEADNCAEHKLRGSIIAAHLLIFYANQ